jgi:hypothetical protein
MVKMVAFVIISTFPAPDKAGLFCPEQILKTIMANAEINKFLRTLLVVIFFELKWQNDNWKNTKLEIH